MSETRLMMKPTKPNPELDRLIEQSRSHVMTPEELAAQRKSWVTGEMMLEHPEMSKETASEMYDNMLRELGYVPPKPKE